DPRRRRTYTITIPRGAAGSPPAAELPAQDTRSPTPSPKPNLTTTTNPSAAILTNGNGRPSFPIPESSLAPIPKFPDTRAVQPPTHCRRRPIPTCAKGPFGGVGEYLYEHPKIDTRVPYGS